MFEKLIFESQKQGLFAFEMLRFLNFTVQQKTLPLMNFLATGKNIAMTESEKAKLPLTLRKLIEILQKDSAKIAEGIFPIEILKPESFVSHFWRLPKLYQESYQMARRRDKNDSKDFSETAKEYLNDIPEYFKRNFHFQADGYLSTESAELYEHQVEILFSGAGDPMRRLFLPMMRKSLSSNGQGLKFLEIGAGTGRLSHFVKLMYPKAKITVTDASDPYLTIARDRLKGQRHLDFVQCFGEKLPFHEEEFDVVYSCFLFHELPEAVRRQVINETNRVLKPGGYIGIVDSLQKSDDPEMDIWLEGFPRNFHEPFYKNYIENKLEDMLSEKFKTPDREIGFLSKALWAKKKNSAH
jgi:ubiquinone/menaquinone biosynthesis C-methylase UbiE